MNYPFTTNILKLLAKQSITAKEFVESMTGVIHMYTRNINEVAFNLVGSHDTPRILTECEEDMDRVKQVFTLLLTFIGTPCIYYGDEIGMSGTQDPGCRKCMEWEKEKQNADLFNHIQKLVQLRMTHPLLRNAGELSFIDPEHHDNCLAYMKSNDDNTILVILNTSENSVEYPLPYGLNEKTVKNLWTGQVIELSNDIVQLQGNGFAILEF